MAASPALEQVELPLARAAGEVMASALQQELAIRGEADGAVGPVHLLLDNQMPTGERLKRHYAQIIIAVLEAGALDVARARIFVHLVHGSGLRATRSM